MQSASFLALVFLLYWCEVNSDLTIAALIWKAANSIACCEEILSPSLSLCILLKP